MRRFWTPATGVLMAALLAAAPDAVRANANTGGSFMQQTRFTDMLGWGEDNHSAALTVFVAQCGQEADTGTLGIPAGDIAALCAAARTSLGTGSARNFFEQNFTPFRLTQKGFLTGYYEPELSGSLTRSETFSEPLLGPPEGLRSLNGITRPPYLDAKLTHALRTDDGWQEMPDRGAIMDGALEGMGLEQVWLRDRVEAFFVHVQGSARIRLEDGSAVRVGYAGKTGHPYTSIARELVKRGEGTPESLTMTGLRAWLAAHPDEVGALLRQNRSYIFFERKPIEDPSIGPIGAAGIPLTAGRNLAMDRDQHTFGTPVFVSADLDVPLDGVTQIARLTVIADTGSAITGPGRADLFVGSGVKAGRIAGEIRNRADIVLLVPNAAADAFASRHK